MRSFMAALFLIALATPLAAQAHAGHAAEGGPLPTGWKGRVDNPARGSIDQVKFVADSDKLHVTTGPAAILWQPETRAAGNFTITSTFTQPQPPARLDAYGLFFGGSNLEADNQEYLYFLIRHDGAFIVKHRGGPEAHTIQDWTPHAAVRRPDANGRSVNKISVDVSAAKVSFLVNDTEVASFDRALMSGVDGVVGLRVNHGLDVIADGIEISRK